MNRVIVLSVMPYCGRCPNFTPEKYTTPCKDYFPDSYLGDVDTTIVCAHREHCETIVNRRIREELTGDA